MTPRADGIASIVIATFDKLPSKCKPVVRDNGLHEWVPLSGIVAEIQGEFICLALATGMKCLPASKLSESKGVALHDWHAEILAIRAFNRFVLDECHRIAQGSDSRIIRRRDATNGHCTPLFEVRDTVKLHMYCSEAPCGDASMELTMSDQADAVPWDLPVAPTNIDQVSDTTSAKAALPGRAYFSQLGVVRRKPARGDAQPTLSKSCSDKLALKQCTSLLGSLASLYVHVSGAYIDTFIIPRSRFSAIGCTRAFFPKGRMAPVRGALWDEGYAFKPFGMETTDSEFHFSKKRVSERADRMAASNLGTFWTLSGIQETTIGGVIRGRRPFDIRGASSVSRLQMWTVAQSLARHLAGDLVHVEAPEAATYKDIKAGPSLDTRRTVKAEARARALAGWVVDDQDSDFSVGP